MSWCDPLVSAIGTCLWVCASTRWAAIPIGCADRQAGVDLRPAAAGYFGGVACFDSEQRGPTTDRADRIDTSVTLCPVAGSSRARNAVWLRPHLRPGCFHASCHLLPELLWPHTAPDGQRQSMHKLCNAFGLPRTGAPNPMRNVGDATVLIAYFDRGHRRADEVANVVAAQRLLQAGTGPGAPNDRS